MKPHQKEGLVFLYNCITGLTENNGTGCILADEMGLGKTLTAISLIYTLLTQSPWSKPFITSAVVTCPSSLVDNWGSEFMWVRIVTSMSRKWIGSGRIRCIVLKEKGSKAEEKIHEFVLQSGLNRTVLIVSYEVAIEYSISSRCTESMQMRSTQARQVCWCVMKVTAWKAQRETQQLIVCCSFLHVVAFYYQEHLFRMIWRYWLNVDAIVGVVCSLRICESRDFLLAGFLSPTFCQTYRGWKEKGLQWEWSCSCEYAIDRSTSVIQPIPSYPESRISLSFVEQLLQFFNPLFRPKSHIICSCRSLLYSDNSMKGSLISRSNHWSTMVAMLDS